MMMKKQENGKKFKTTKTTNNNNVLTKIKENEQRAGEREREIRKEKKLGKRKWCL